MLTVVNNKTARLILLGRSGHPPVRLMPGINRVNAEALTDARRAHAADYFFTSGVVVIEDQASDGLADLALGKALSLVNDTYDVPLLREWLRSEKRDPIMEAIDLQIELLTK